MADSATAATFVHCAICKRVLKPDEPHQHPFRVVSEEGAPFAAVIDASNARDSDELAILMAQGRTEFRQHVSRVFRIDIMPSRYDIRRSGNKMTTELDEARPIEFIAVEV